MLKSVHENLQQLVFDEDKIVTYKLLTKLLQINVQAAKKYLQDFYDLNHGDLNAFYILVGIQKDENEQKVTKIVIVPSTEFEETKKSFLRVTSSHIYSIHKGQLVDKSALFSADCEGETHNQGLNEYSSIKNPHVRIESQKKRTKGTAAPVIEQEKSLPPPVNKKQKVEEKKSSNSSPVQEKPLTSPPEKKLIKGDEGSKGTNSKYKNSNIFSMFQKQQNVKKAGAQKESKNGADVAVSDAKSNLKEEKNLSVQSEQKEKKDIRNLFSKQTDKRAQFLPEQNTNVKPPTVNASNKRNQSSKSSTKQKRLSKKNKKKNDSDSDESMKPQKKKHRRIMELEDSESDSENEEMMDKAQRELVHCEPDISTVLIAGASAENPNLSDDNDCIPPTPVAGGKKKKWKMVSKTFTDESGFLVTKKTKEYVTDSEESGEEQKESKAPAADKEPVKKTSFANKKQASLMSFFRQK